MKKKRKVAVYGTLREGYGLHDLLEEPHASFVGIAEVTGFRMYTFSKDYFSYPIVARTDRVSDKIEVELYEYNDNMSGKAAMYEVDSIEFGAGYELDKVVVDGVEYDIYVQDEEYCERCLHRVESGNFNEFASSVR